MTSDVLQIPEAAEVPFISSLAVPRSSAGAGVGSALNSFMKYDKKWRGKEGIKVSVKKAETDSDSEPVITENSVASPVKIAEELEEKIFPNRSISPLVMGVYFFLKFSRKRPKQF